MAGPKKVLIFSLAYYPRVGGAEVAIKELTDRISDIEFHMVTLRFSSADATDEQVGRVHVHRVGNGGSYLDKILFVPRAARIARRLHAHEHFDGAWAMMSYMLFPLVLARLGIPYALTLQEGDSYGHMFARIRILPFLPLINRGFRKARVVQAISTYLGSWARTRGFTGPLEIIPNGVDLDRFTNTQSESPLRRSWGRVHLSEAEELSRSAILITTSRLVHKNAIDDVIRALPQLPDVRFKILGTGPDKAMLASLAADLGVTDCVEFVGHVDHEQLPAHLHAADIFVRPSRTEGMGNSFIEAFAAGLPVIATQEGGLSDFITPEVAWPVRKDNPADIVAAVKNIMGNPAHTAQVVTTARQLAQRYDWALLARDMRDRVFARLFA